MYLISQFSKISGLTVKALRYYDEQNILKPSHRDKDTLYRLYDESDLEKAQLIKLLRTLDFSISEMKAALDMVENDTDLTCILQEKIEHIETNIAKEKALIKKINNYLSPLPSNPSNINYDITIDVIPASLVASIRFSDKYDQLGRYVPILYKAAKNNVNGSVINCYYDEECTEIADMELCLPIRKQISDSTINCKRLPAVKAVCTTHYGSYETLYLAYKALFEYVNKQNISLLTPSREIYVKGPGMIFKGNSQDYVTKVILPFQIL